MSVDLPFIALTILTLGTSLYANSFSFQKLLLPEVLLSNKSQDPTSSPTGEANWDTLPLDRVIASVVSVYLK